MQISELQIDNSVNDRILYLAGDVTTETISEICKQILAINDIDTKNTNKFRNYDMQPIQLYIQSYGGSVDSMWSLIDIIESSTTPIITYCSGYCMSAAALIFLAGHIRCMFKHSSIMFHQMTVGTIDKLNDFNIEQERFNKMHKKMIKYLKKHTNLGKKFYKRFDDNKENIYLTPKKCKKFGICDEIIENTDWRETLTKSLDEDQHVEIES